jgi:alpha-ketoglutarate-dependent taurine dioxygenase
MNPFFLKVVSCSSSDDFAAELTKTLKKYKIVHLTGIPDGVDYKDFYAGLVDKLGKIVNVDEDIKTGNANSNERWTDVRYDKNYDFTFRHANTRQPLHTDAAYVNFDQDVNFFFCLEQAEIGGATTFIETTEVDFGKGEDQRKKRKIIDSDERGIVLNWNYFRIMPDNPDDVKQMCEEFHAFLENKIVSGGLLTVVCLAPGECVFFQDDRILHGRNSFYGNRNLIKGGFNFIHGR